MVTNPHQIIYYCVLEMKNRYIYVNVQNLGWNHANGCWETDVRWLDRFKVLTIHFTNALMFTVLLILKHTQHKVSSQMMMCLLVAIVIILLLKMR